MPALSQFLATVKLAVSVPGFSSQPAWRLPRPNPSFILNWQEVKATVPAACGEGVSASQLSRLGGVVLSG